MSVFFSDFLQTLQYLTDTTWVLWTQTDQTCNKTKILLQSRDDEHDGHHCIPCVHHNGPWGPHGEINCPPNNNCDARPLMDSELSRAEKLRAKPRFKWCTHCVGCHDRLGFSKVHIRRLWTPEEFFFHY